MNEETLKEIIAIASRFKYLTQEGAEEIIAQFKAYVDSLVGGE